MAASNSPDPPSALSDAELLARLPEAAALPDAPADWQRRALSAWRTRPSLAEAIQALRERVLAVLSFDSWASAPLAAGLRSTGSTTRQLVFSAEGRDIDLRIAPKGPHFTLNGQVLGPDDHGAVVLSSELSQSIEHEAVLDELGEFTVSDVPPGRYRVTLMLSQHEIALPAIDIGGKEDGAG